MISPLYGPSPSPYFHSSACVLASNAVSRFWPGTRMSVCPW